MFCVQCGSKVSDGSKFCTECGAPMPAPRVSYPPDAPAGPAAQTPQRPAAPQPVMRQPVPAPAPVSVQQPAVQPAPAASKYKGLLVCAILFTVLAYLTSNLIALGIGIIAIVQAAKAKKKEKLGLADEAKAAARTAKALNITAIVLEIIWIITLIIALVVLIRAGLQNIATLSGQSPEEIQEFLRQYGYEYDIDLIREYLRQNAAVFLGF